MADNRWTSTSSSGRWTQAPSSARWESGDASSARWVQDASAGRVESLGESESLLRVFNNESGVFRLPRDITINGTTVAPFIRYVGESAGASTWTAGVGGNLSVAGSGTDPVTDDLVPTTLATEESVWFRSGKYYEAAALDTSTGDVGTEDLVLEAVIRSPLAVSASHEEILGKTVLAPTKLGWRLEAASTGRFWFEIDDATGNAGIVTDYYEIGAWYHVMVFADRSGSAQFYLNGAASGSPASIATRAGTLSNTSIFRIGRDSGTYDPFGGSVMYVSGWKSAAWLDTHLQATVAKERFSLLSGVYADASRGTAVPKTMTRNSHAYIRNVNGGGASKLNKVGLNWIRVEERIDSLGQQITGVMIESAATNYLGAGSDTWGSWNMAALSTANNTTDLTSPGGMYNAAKATDSGAASSHHGWWLWNAVSGTTYTFSFFGKYGSGAPFAYITMDLSGAGDPARGFFNLQTGVLGTIAGGGSPTGGIENIGNGWYRCFVSGACSGASGSRALEYGICKADDTRSYTADGSYNYFWGGNLGVAQSPPTLVYKASGAYYTDNTRAADSLIYDSNNLNGTRFDISCNVLYPKTTSSLTHRPFINIGTSPDVIHLHADSSDYAEILTEASGGNSGQSTAADDLDDNEVHAISALVVTNRVQVISDGTAATADTSADITTSLADIDIGHEASTDYAGVLIGQVKIDRRK